MCVGGIGGILKVRGPGPRPHLKEVRGPEPPCRSPPPVMGARTWVKGQEIDFQGQGQGPELQGQVLCLQGHCKTKDLSFEAKAKDFHYCPLPF